jgi:cytochrome P450
MDFRQGKPMWEVLGGYGKDYGGLSVIWMLSTPSIVLNDPLLIRQVLLTLEQQEKEAIANGRQPSRCPFTQAMNFYKDLPLKALRPMLTDTSTFIAKDQGATWQSLSANDPFNLSYFHEWLDHQLESLKDFMVKRAESFITSSDSQTFPAYETIQKLTFDGFSLATVGQVFPDTVFQQFQHMCVTGTQRMTLSSFSNGLIPKNPWGAKYRRASRKWFALFSQVIAKSSQVPQDQCLLGWVNQRGGSDFNAGQMRNFIAGVYPGGAISAPSGTISALHLLWQNPEVMPALLKEVELLMSQPLTLARLEECQLLDQLLRETLRLRPPVPFFNRNVGVQGVQLAGKTIPAKTQIFIPNWYLHRLPNHWPQPEQFNPRRWDALTCEQNPYGSDYFFPFGRGNRSCIGQGFARVFMKLTIAVLVHHLQIEFGPEPETPEFYFAVSVPRQLRVQFSRR